MIDFVQLCVAVILEAAFRCDYTEAQETQWNAGRCLDLSARDSWLCTLAHKSARDHLLRVASWGAMR